jgi:hypothetical protein
VREILRILAAVASEVLGRLRRWLTSRRVLGIVAILFGLDSGLALEVSALKAARR